MTASVKSQSHHSILVIGGSFAGLALTHRLLAHTLPTLPYPHTYTITILAPNTQFYWKVGAPRTLINPSSLSEHQLFLDLLPGLEKYGDHFRFIRGVATSIDSVARTVAWEPVGEASNKLGDNKTDKELHYTSLVIASGSKSPSAVWSLGVEGEESSKAALNETRKQLEAARRIVVIGGGATGVETTGEICAKFRNELQAINENRQTAKEVTILSGSTALLTRLTDKRLGRDAEAMLTQLGAKVVHNVRVVQSVPSSSPDGSTTLYLSDGTKLQTDAVLDVTGETPATSFVPPGWLDEKGYVRTITSTLRLDIPGGEGKDVYVLGSAGSYSDGSVPAILFAYKILAESIKLDLLGQPDPANRKKYTPFKDDIQIIPIGPGQGVATMFGWKWPSWLVWLYKSRNFNVSYAAGFVTGKTL